MTRAMPMLMMALVLGACSNAVLSPSPIVSPAPSSTTAISASPAPSPTAAISASPVHELPSNSCGGFHLKIVNGESEDVTVTINGSYSVTVPAGTSQTIVEFLPPHPKPLLPWTVAVSRSTGSEIGTEYFTGPVDQRLTVSGGQLNTAPYDISQEDC